MFEQQLGASLDDGDYRTLCDWFRRRLESHKEALVGAESGEVAILQGRSRELKEMLNGLERARKRRGG